MRRKLFTGLLTAGALAVGLGVAAMPASAEPRTIVLTLLSGQQVSIVVDVAPGTPLDRIALPQLPEPVIGITDAGVAVVPSSDPAAAAPAPPPTPETQTPAAAPTEEPVAGQQEKQSTRRKAPQRQSAVAGQESSVEGDGTATGEAASGAIAGAAASGAFRSADGVPTVLNPTLSIAQPGPALIGVPNFIIDRFRIPPFLLPIYQAAGIQYGVRWEVLAAINEIETDYGRNLNISTAGAEGWMQFMPATWKTYGVDANRDGRRDPYNPADAIFAAARYLKAAGAQDDLRRAIFAYNHADWYVESVVMRAQLIGGLPADLVGSLTGLTEGHFPVRGKARYADDVAERTHLRRTRRSVANLVASNPSRRGISIFAKAGAPAIAVNDGVIKKLGTSKRLGRYVILQDVYGNRYTYAGLKKRSTVYPVLRNRIVSKAQIASELKLPKGDPAPTAAATAGRRTPTRSVAVSAPRASVASAAKQRLFANPARVAARRSGGAAQLAGRSRPVAAAGAAGLRASFARVLGLRAQDVKLRRLRVGARVIAGTILGRIGRTSKSVAPHLVFEIRPAGRGAPRIDPKPILDGWKLLEATGLYRAAGKNPFLGDARAPSIGQILLMSKETLARRVLANDRIKVYDCGRQDIRAGEIDRRILAMLEFLAGSGLKPTVSSLNCGHGFYTASGNVSEHSSGNAVDIAAINGVPIVGHQGAGSITELTIRRLLTLQGQMQPHQIISLMKFQEADNTFAMADHYDHIHVGFKPMFGDNANLGRQVDAILKPGQWLELSARLGKIKNPVLGAGRHTTPRRARHTRSSRAHVGD